MIVVRTAVLTLSSLCMSAQAEWRCDCTTIIDTCSATVTVEDDAVLIESGHRQCARVDYLIDGLPFVALVVDGREQQSWLSRTENPRVLMQSCRVCLDNADDSAVPTLSPRTVEREPAGEQGLAGAEVSHEEPPASEEELSPLIAVDPQYPPFAVTSGIGGYVEVSFTVTALGRVENVIVTAAEPQGVFEQAALSAISRWRYDADERRQATALSHRFDFRPQAAAVDSSASSHPASETVIDALIASSAARRDGFDTEVAVSEPQFAARNQCIREQVSYDFGEMVDVNLMNTCSEPLLVYSCAEGMGRYQRRWVCHSTENAQSILVRPGDRLAGNAAMIEVPEGVRTFKYSEDLFVARARNTEYWWLACSVEDAECRGSGRQWARSMDGKPASVDPQLWTQQVVARSY